MSNLKINFDEILSNEYNKNLIYKFMDIKSSTPPYWNTCDVDKIFQLKDMFGISRSTMIIPSLSGFKIKINDEFWVIDIHDKIYRKIYTVYDINYKINKLLNKVENIEMYKNNQTLLVENAGLNKNYLIIQNKNPPFITIKDKDDVEFSEVIVNLNQWNESNKCGIYGNVVFVKEYF